MSVFEVVFIEYMCDIAQTLNLKKHIFHKYPPEGKHLKDKVDKVDKSVLKEE